MFVCIYIHTVYVCVHTAGHLEQCHSASIIRDCLVTGSASKEQNNKLKIILSSLIARGGQMTGGCTCNSMQ